MKPKTFIILLIGSLISVSFLSPVDSSKETAKFIAGLFGATFAAFIFFMLPLYYIFIKRKYPEA